MKFEIGVDENIEKIYFTILRKMLAHPDKWIVSHENSQCYESPSITKGSDVVFRTISAILRTTRCDSIEIYKTDKNGIYHKICELKISWLDFGTRKLIKNLFNYWVYKAEIDKYEKISKTLKDSLGPEYERFIKITKIKSKL